MNIFTKAWAALRQPEYKGIDLTYAGDADFVTELRDYRRPTYPDADTGSLQSVHLRNALVFACIDAKATTAQDPRIEVRQARRDGQQTVYEPVIDHPFRRLFMRPNPEMTEADLMRAAIVSWDISNPRRFYCEKVYERGLLTALYPLNPAAMQPLYSRADTTRRIGWLYTNSGYRVEYSDDEVLVRSAPQWYAPPPMVAALGNVESDSAQTDYVRAYFENGGVPSGFLKYKTANLSQEQRESIRAKWRATYGRLGRQHDIGVLDAEVDYQEIGASLDKLQSEIMRQIDESRICMTFKVPPLIVYAYVGLVRATYSNLAEAGSWFWDATMSPLYKEWRSFWTWHLLPEFEELRDIQAERLQLHYDMSQVAALQEDVDAAHARARANFQAGAITLNELRSIIGVQPDPAGDYYVRSIAAQAVEIGTNSPTLPEPQPVKRGVQPQHVKAFKASSTEPVERRVQRQIHAAAQQTWRRLAEQVQQEAAA